MIVSVTKLVMPLFQIVNHAKVCFFSSFFFFECCIYYLSSLVGFFFPNIENISGSLFKMLLALGCGSCFIDSFDQVQSNHLPYFFSSLNIISFPWTEVNECELGTAACEQICINTEGSYRCDCRNGYHLDFDNHNCLDINECQIGVPGCFGDCINTLGRSVVRFFFQCIIM